MKIVLIILLQCILSCAMAQTGTIRVKKSIDSTNIVSNCDFKLIADSSLYDQTFRLLMFSIKGVNKKNAENFNSKIRYFRGRPIIVTKEKFTEDMKEVCETKKYKLQSIKVYKSQDAKYSDDYVIVEFTLTKK